MRKITVLLALLIAGVFVSTASPMVISDGGGGSCTWIYSGTSAAETFNGTSAKDCMYGSGGNDYMVGNAGIDQIYGNSGADTLAGGTEGDTLSGGPGYDNLYGGDGNDYLYLDEGGLDAGAFCGAGSDTLVIDNADTGIPIDSCETIVLQLSPQHTF